MPYASFVAFDAPNREVCTVKRPRTNTPLQALVLLNDPVYVEAARGLAQRMMIEGGRTKAERAAYGFRLATARQPTKKELQVMLELYEKQRKRFSHDLEAARSLVTTGESDPMFGLDLSELAAWTTVGNMLLNLDETITKS